MKRMKWLISAAALVALTAPPTADATPSAPVTWGCRPDQSPSPCDAKLDTTVLASTSLQPRKVARIEHTLPDARRSVDCFYVYPTISSALRPNAPMALTREVQSILAFQAARFSQVCDVWAPLYRQVTVAGLFAPLGRIGPSAGRAFEVAYRDVLAAWHQYSASRRGRGVVLIGHSQGSLLLTRLLREEIDPYPAERGRIVSAILAGGNFVTPRGQRLGGDLQHLPTCQSADENGCVIAWSTFASRPPRTSLFGRANSALRTQSGLPDVADGSVACVNPAELSGDAGMLTPISRTKPFPGPLGFALKILYYGIPPRASTPWLVPGEKYRARCTESNGANVLIIKPASFTTVVPLNSPTPDWGLHLADLNLPLGNLITVVRRQRTTWEQAHGPT